MRRPCVAVLGLVLLAPVLPAQNQRGDKTTAAKTPAQQYGELSKAFHDRMAELLQKFKTAGTEEEKSKVRDQALKDLPAEYGQKMLALAEAHPKDPAAVNALVWVCAQVPQAPQVPQALDVLLRDHGANEKLALACSKLATRDDGLDLLRAVRTKAGSKVVQLSAGFFLAEALNEKDEPTAEQSREAEKLLAEFVDQSKDLDLIPHDMVKKAEGTLWEVRNLRIGKAAPEAEAEDLGGKAVQLSAHKGKVVVLDFWATWCVPCVGMIPHERELVQKNAGKPFVLISVSGDEKKESLQKFLAKEPMPWTHWWSGEQGLVEKWNVRAYPTIYVIDAKGVIRAKIGAVGPDTEKKLDELVEKLVQEAR